MQPESQSRDHDQTMDHRIDETINVVDGSESESTAETLIETQNNYSSSAEDLDMEINRESDGNISESSEATLDSPTLDLEQNPLSIKLSDDNDSSSGDSDPPSAPPSASTKLQNIFSNSSNKQFRLFQPIDPIEPSDHDAAVPQKTLIFPNVIATPPIPQWNELLRQAQTLPMFFLHLDSNASERSLHHTSPSSSTFLFGRHSYESDESIRAQWESQRESLRSEYKKKHKLALRKRLMRRDAK